MNHSGNLLALILKAQTHLRNMKIFQLITSHIHFNEIWTKLLKTLLVILQLQMK